MGYETSISGSLRIEPPLKWGEYRGMGVPTQDTAREYDLYFYEETEETRTEEGEFTRRWATSLEAPEESAKYYVFDSEVQTIVSAFPDHRFIGYFEGIGEGHGQDREDIWRVFVVDGKVKRVKPKITVVWPDMPGVEGGD